MHGLNTPRHLERADKGYQVADIFYTIQGEGPFAGLPAVFIRLTGCNLKCSWCDTVWDDELDPYTKVEAIAEKVASFDCPLVVITGGEPCRWDLFELLQILKSYKVQVETAGTLWQSCLQQDHVTIVCSPKVSKVHPMFLKHCEHWKYVVTDGDVNPEDGLPVRGTQRVGKERGAVTVGGPMARPPKDRKVNIYLQPCDEADPIKNKANQDHMVKIAMQYGYRAGLQLHKIFNLP